MGVKLLLLMMMMSMGVASVVEGRCLHVHGHIGGGIVCHPGRCVVSIPWCDAHHAVSQTRAGADAVRGALDFTKAMFWTLWPAPGQSFAG